MGYVPPAAPESTLHTLARIVDVGSAIQTPDVAAFALVGAGIRAAYRAVLRWATTT